MEIIKFIDNHQWIVLLIIPIIGVFKFNKIKEILIKLKNSNLVFAILNTVNDTFKIFKRKYWDKWNCIPWANCGNIMCEYRGNGTCGGDLYMYYRRASMVILCTKHDSIEEVNKIHKGKKFNLGDVIKLFNIYRK